MTHGILLGMDWHGKLDEYNRSGGKAAQTTALVPQQAAAVVGSTSQSTATSELERELQQLFLKADPALRKRFIGWAVPQL